MANKKKKDYCTAFDLSYKHKSNFATLFLETCLSRLASKKTLIIPPESVIKKIKEKKTRDAQKKILLNYVIKTPIKFKIDDLFKKGEGFLYSYNPKMHYILTKKNGKTLFNGVEVTLITNIDDNKTALYRSSKELTPIEYIPKIVIKKTGGGIKCKKRKRMKIGGTKKKKIGFRKKKTNIIEFKDQDDLDDVIQRLIL
jgi:hypothetical protein